MFTKTVAAAVVALTVGSAAHAAPVLMNGDFTNSLYGVNSQFGAQGGQGVTSWTGDQGYEIYFTSAAASSTVSAISQYGGGKEKLYGPVPSSPTGGAFVGLDGDPGVQASISQLVTGLVVGNAYNVSFSWAAGQLQSRFGQTTEELAVSLGGQTVDTSVVTNPSGGFTGWFTNTFTYTATATSETLKFLSIGTPGGLPPIALLDGVSISAVPEPATLALLGLPLAGLLMYRRRQQQG